MVAVDESNLRSNRSVDAESTPPSIRIARSKGHAPLELSELRFSSAGPRDAATGLLGWVSFTLNDALRLDGVAVRRTRSGCLTLAFPAPLKGSGRRRELVRPVDAAARERIERLVLRVVERELGG